MSDTQTITCPACERLDLHPRYTLHRISFDIVRWSPDGSGKGNIENLYLPFMKWGCPGISVHGSRVTAVQAATRRQVGRSRACPIAEDDTRRLPVPARPRKAGRNERLHSFLYIEGSAAPRQGPGRDPEGIPLLVSGWQAANGTGSRTAMIPFTRRGTTKMGSHSHA
jgi:hypothetical protein